MSKSKKKNKNKEIERRVLPVVEAPISLQYREEDQSGLPGIVGYSAVFGVDTEIQTFFGAFKERIQKGAFRRAIREAQNVRALRNHNPDNLLGSVEAKTLKLKEDDTGLYIQIDTPNTTTGRDTVELIERGDLSGMSFAFIIRKEKWINGEDGAPDMRIIQDVDLFDVGPVTYPAYEETSTDLRSTSVAYRSGMEQLGKEVPSLPVEAIEPAVPVEPIEPEEPIKEEEQVQPGETVIEFNSAGYKKRALEGRVEKQKFTLTEILS